IVLEDHLPKRWAVRGRCAQQFRKQGAFFFRLMLVVCKRAKKTQNGLHVFHGERLILLNPRRHVIQNVERAQDGLVFLGEKIRAFHETALLRFLNASANPWSPENCSTASANDAWCDRRLA